MDVYRSHPVASSLSRLTCGKIAPPYQQVGEERCLYNITQTAAWSVFLTAQFFSVAALPAYRMLTVCVHDRTGSLLVAMLIHTSLVASTLTLPPLALSGVALVTYDLVWAAALWVVVAVVAVANGRHLSRQPLRRRMA